MDICLNHRNTIPSLKKVAHLSNVKAQKINNNIENVCNSVYTRTCLGHQCGLVDLVIAKLHHGVSIGVYPCKVSDALVTVHANMQTADTFFSGMFQCIYKVRKFSGCLLAYLEASRTVVESTKCGWVLHTGEQAV